MSERPAKRRRVSSPSELSSPQPEDDASTDDFQLRLSAFFLFIRPTSTARGGHDSLFIDHLLATPVPQPVVGIRESITRGLSAEFLPKVKKILHELLNDSWGAVPTADLALLLSFYPVGVLREFVHVTTSDEVYASIKTLLCAGIKRRFFSGSWLCERTDEEREVLQFQRDGLLSYYCSESRFPMRWLEKLSSLLDTTMYWYVLILTTWNSLVRIRKSNMLTIPLIVLRNGTKFGFSYNHFGSGLKRSPKDFRLAMDRLLSISEKLEELHIEYAHPEQLLVIWSQFKRSCAQREGVFDRVRKLAFSYVPQRRQRKQIRLPNFRLSELFPSLKTVHHPPTLKCCDDLPLREICFVKRDALWTEGEGDLLPVWYRSVDGLLLTINPKNEIQMRQVAEVVPQLRLLDVSFHIPYIPLFDLFELIPSSFGNLNLLEVLRLKNYPTLHECDPSVTDTALVIVIPYLRNGILPTSFSRMVNLRELSLDGVPQSVLQVICSNWKLTFPSLRTLSLLSVDYHDFFDHRTTNVNPVVRALVGSFFCDSVSRCLHLRTSYTRTTLSGLRSEIRCCYQHSDAEAKTKFFVTVIRLLGKRLGNVWLVTHPNVFGECFAAVTSWLIVSGRKFVSWIVGRLPRESQVACGYEAMSDG